ncbi:MAG: hypothetical protein MRJ96_00800 [Nitrospirales bacterium]|nr:hypothetical protein [Nitrospira sp.]MDR4499979.1 hypothetical protein [Nitrospirales bacterium]
MNFDPAIAARQALRQSEECGELGEFEDDVLETEETFSSIQGPEATQAYKQLQCYGEQLPDARYFQEFLVYITWQQVTEGPLPEFFQQGLTLCDRFMERFSKDIINTPSYDHVLALRQSFQAGLGIETEDIIEEHEEDAFAGGD